MNRTAHFLLAAALLLLAACAYPIRNPQLGDAPIDGKYGYRWRALAANGPADTLVIVTASGGGTRAAALELGVLEALERIKLKPAARSRGASTSFPRSPAAASPPAISRSRGRRAFPRWSASFAATASPLSS